jgi:DNA polymerase III subunit delta
MRLNIDQLSSHLKRSDLAPVYLLTGDEPLQMMEAADQIRAHARSAGAERTVVSVEKGFEWNQILQESASLSLFASRRLLELRMNDQSPGKEGSEVLSVYAENPAADITLLISMDKMDKRSQQSRWFKAIDQSGVIIQIWPSRLPDWISQRLRQSGKRIDKTAASLIAQRTEGNLLAARQEIDKLCLLTDTDEISLEQVQDSVADSTRFGVFMLIEHALLGDSARIASMLRGLRQEGIEPIGLFGAIMWELRRLCAIATQLGNGASKDKVYAEYRIWNQRQTAINKVLARCKPRQLDAMLAEAALIDRSLKGAIKRNPWELLEGLLFRLAGINLHPGTMK